jgi:hypothetical protein
VGVELSLTGGTSGIVLVVGVGVPTKIGEGELWDGGAVRLGWGKYPGYGLKSGGYWVSAGIAVAFSLGAVGRVGSGTDEVEGEAVVSGSGVKEEFGVPIRVGVGDDSVLEVSLVEFCANMLGGRIASERIVAKIRVRHDLSRAIFELYLSRYKYPLP